jgi:hypothetical protein
MQLLGNGTMAQINPHQHSINCAAPGRLQAGYTASGPNVIERLQQRIRDAKGMGFRIRSEWLDDQQATWCEIGGVKTIFIDRSQTAAEQLEQLEESLASLASECDESEHIASESPPQRAA